MRDTAMVHCPVRSLVRRRHPDSDLGAGGEAELVHDVADVSSHRPVGDKEARSDLLVESSPVYRS
jgi:hypothetical protein